ncbi:MAG: hypothetical protein C0P75_007885 [Bacilli bacterium]|uniref:Uncharacterized protein n=1 Tax=Ureibacillus suwonensis TaxID=313007 RepID=A0ABW0REQ3_9BACL|nr:hypothetical protein [Bacilli bacterium]
MSMMNGQLLELIHSIEKLPKSVQISTYYYLRRNIQEMDDEEYSFINHQQKKEESSWVNAFMEYHFDSK